MKKPVLVIMAAGMGSRYGGLKQIDPVDAKGRIIVDFPSLMQNASGVEQVIFIIKKEQEDLFAMRQLATAMSRIHGSVLCISESIIFGRFSGARRTCEAMGNSTCGL